MLIQKVQNIACAIAVGAFLVVSGHGRFAQSQPAPQEKAIDQKKAGDQEKPVEKKAKSSAESCDGALDIVPVKSMTFTRKRRQASAESAAPTDAKPESKPDSPGAKDPKDNLKTEKPRQNEEKP